MDIKSKKSKIIISFLCFFFSTTILICSAAAAFYAACNFHAVKQSLEDAFAADYQETDQFKEVIASQLQSMTDLLCDNITYDQYTKITDTDDFSFTATGNNMLYKMKNFDRSYAFSNLSDTGSTGITNLSTGDLPEGYNFRLYFDGKKVTITKDGKNIDVYGSGIYRADKGMWRVPGYSNLNFSKADLEHCRITILVRQEPSESTLGTSPLYNIINAQRSTRAFLFIGGGILLLGILLFVLYIVFRREKKQADLALACFSGWFWFEFKAFCLLCLLWLDREIIGRTWHNHLFNLGMCIVISILGYYITINDMRYNPQFYNHNIFHSALKAYRRLEKGKPFQKQMVYRFWTLLGSEILLLLFFAAVAAKYRSDFSAHVFLLCVFAIMVYLIYRYVRRFQNTVNDIGLFIDQISLIKDGNFVTPLNLPNNADLSEAANELNTIQSGFSTAVEERLRSERMKIDLITNVSHDIKTPLTSIISYIDLLKQEDGLPDHVKDYIRVLAEKSDRLKNMVQDIFDVSKATSGNMELTMEPLDLGKLLRQTLADMNDEVEASGLTFKPDIPDSPVMISADGQRLYRVFQNLVKNALQYSLEGSRVFITLAVCGDKACVSIKNISKFELDTQKDITERFVRGDHSRSTDGSGLGLSIARSFTEACRGNFSVRTDADLFTVCVEFRRIESL